MSRQNIQLNTTELSPRHNFTPFSGMSIESLLRQKSSLETKLRQVQLELEEKQYYYQEIQQKANENRQLYSQIAKDFNDFKTKMKKITDEKDFLINKINSEVQIYKISEDKLLKQLKNYEHTLLQLTDQNNRIKKEIVQKNIFIECYLKKDKEFSQTQQKRKQLTSHKKKYHQRLFESAKKSQDQNPIEPLGQKNTEQE